MIHTNKCAVELDVKNRLLYFQDGKNVYDDNLISSIPLPEIISIMIFDIKYINGQPTFTAMVITA